MENVKFKCHLSRENRDKLVPILQGSNRDQLVGIFVETVTKRSSTYKLPPRFIFIDWKDIISMREREEFIIIKIKHKGTETEYEAYDFVRIKT